MTPLQIAREKLLSAACGLLANRLYTEVSQPGPHDDASAEMHEEMLDQAAREYYRAGPDDDPLLGLVTTEKLMDELIARNIIGSVLKQDLTPADLNYRTVES